MFEIETLEDRRLMSSSTTSLFAPFIPGMPITQTSATAASTATPTASTSDSDDTSVPDLVGDFAGKVKISVLLFSKKFGFDMHVTSQTDTSVTGSITVAGHTFKGTISVTWSGDSFSMKFKDKHISGTLKGTVSDDDTHLAGTFKGSGYGLSGSGKVTADKTT